MSQDASVQSDERVESIRNHLDDDLVSAAAELDDVDVDDIIRATLDSEGEFGDSTIARFVKSTLQTQVEAAKAESYEGIIMGSRDRYGANWPRRHSLIRSDGQHMQVNTWQGSLPTPDGSETPIPVGGVPITVDCTYDEEYDSYNAEMIRGVNDGVGRSKILQALGSVALEPEQIGPGDEYQVVVVRGKIFEVEPQTLFEDGEPAGDGPLLMDDERGNAHPHCEIRLERSGDTYFRANLERRAYSKPYIDVPDFNRLCARAVERFDDPGDQANLMTSGLEGAEVIVVGNVSNFNRDRDGDGNPVKYIDVGATAIVSMEQTLEEAAQTTESESSEDEDPEPEPEAEPEPEPEPEPEEEPSEGSGSVPASVEAATYQDLRGVAADVEGVPGSGISEDELRGRLLGELGEEELADRLEADDQPDEPPDSGASPDAESVREVRDAVESYADITGEPLDDITVADVNEKMQGVDADDVVIRAALNEFEPEESGESDPAGGGIEALKVGGSYSCPIGGELDPNDDNPTCPGSAGSEAGLYGHMDEVHDLGVSGQEWVRTHVEG